jgi:hypothetical protein
VDDKTWDGMLAALDAALPPKIQAKPDRGPIRSYRETFWEILKLTGADTSDFQSCPTRGVCTPDIPRQAFREVMELRARFDRLEQFVIWVAENEVMADPFDPSGGHRLNDMIDAAKEALDDI